VTKLMQGWFLVVLMAGNVIALEDVGIGQERIVPLHYPKFSLGADYSVWRHFHGLADERIRFGLENRMDYTMSFEAGLLKYLNAGAMFLVSDSKMIKGEPLDIKLGLFAKPLVPIGERFALFGRVSAGLAVSITFQNSSFLYYSVLDSGKNFKDIYHGQDYAGWPFGGFGAATIGLEYFLFSRVGLAFEWGINATITRANINVPGITKNTVTPGVPSSFNYLIYEMPLMLTLHVIL
jgi:hypothetical protein